MTFSGAGGSRKWVKVVLIGVAVLATNGVTAWLLTRPPPRLPESILPEYRLVDADAARRTFADFVGSYETGGTSGDRALIVAKDGAVRWMKFGAGRAVAEETAVTTQAAESNGRKVLVADNQGMLEFKDAITLVYFGDTYRRKMP